MQKNNPSIKAINKNVRSSSRKYSVVLDSKRWKKVVFPDPVGPIMPTMLPLSIFKDIFSKDFNSELGYLNERLLILMNSLLYCLSRVSNVVKLFMFFSFYCILTYTQKFAAN